MANGSRMAAWEHWGAELKYRRELAGMTQGELGGRVFVSGGYIGQFEQAIRKPQLDVAIRIDEVLQTDGFFERAWRKLIDDKRYPDYFTAVADLERLATKICEFAPAIVPGLLQKAPYTRAVMRAGDPFAGDEQIEEAVRNRLDRAVIFKGATRPVYWAVLHEAALRVPVGGPSAMTEQLNHIAQLVREHTILVQILPFAAGPYPSMGKMLRLLEFDDAPPTAYTEGVHSGNLLDDPAVVKRVQADYDLVRAAALSPEASLALIESAVEDYRRCTSAT
ncbi:helix-turn-helix domain-containing protein [Streptomyces sp. NPDC054765]